MFTRPGYADDLAKDNPELFEQLEEYDAPEGFGDMVAYLVPASDDQGPPNWGITFSVEDADASATRVRELGGQVLVDPFDAPWVRMAVVTRPRRCGAHYQPVRPARELARGDSHHAEHHERDPGRLRGPDALVQEAAASAIVTTG